MYVYIYMDKETTGNQGHQGTTKRTWVCRFRGLPFWAASKGNNKKTPILSLGGSPYFEIYPFDNVARLVVAVLQHLS